jgi:hypothetical protein
MPLTWKVAPSGPQIFKTAAIARIRKSRRARSAVTRDPKTCPREIGRVAR